MAALVETSVAYDITSEYNTIFSEKDKTPL
jgi:hypothetical protein